MENKENKLSNYIDSLNNEKKPKEHESQSETEEMEELFDAVRKVRSLKEPIMPGSSYSKTLSAYINRRLKTKRKWFYGAATAAAVVLIFALGNGMPFNKSSMVYAMEQAYKEVKAYHGILEIVEKTADGKSVVQSKVEVWADKDGRYYAKGLDGAQKGLVTVNDGQRKWQIQPQEKEVDVFTAFPDPYSFTFELGKEIEEVKSAVKTKVIGEDTISGRAADVLEVTPQGGSPYKIWVDKETKMPLQKQTSMEYSIQYKVQYSSIDFKDTIPNEILSYKVPQGFKEINTDTDQVVNTLDEAEKIAGFKAKQAVNLPANYEEKAIAVVNSSKAVKINYISKDNKSKVFVLQKPASGELKPASTAVLGKINNSIAEIQSPIQAEEGVLHGGGAYSGITGLSSVRWQQEGIEYAVAGNISIEELSVFIKGLTDGAVKLAPVSDQAGAKPKEKVPVNMEAEKGDQKNADAGHSPWKLDPIFVSQVFVSLKISPEGINGDYPVKYEEIKLVMNDGKEAVAEVNSSKSPVKRVYLKKLIRQDSTGIWTVVGYDPVSK